MFIHLDIYTFWLYLLLSKTFQCTAETTCKDVNSFVIVENVYLWLFKNYLIELNLMLKLLF